MSTYRQLLDKEIATLLVYGCSAEDWKRVLVAEDFSPKFFNNTHFSGTVYLGTYDKVYELPGGVKKHSGIYNCQIHNCKVGNDVLIDKVNNYIANYDIEDECYIENVNLLYVDGSTTFGNGVKVPVLNEAGGREVPIFDRLSAPLAYMMVLYRHRPQMIQKVEEMIEAYAFLQKSDRGTIGRNVKIVNSGVIKNVRVGAFAKIQGASLLTNGTINSNAEAPVFIGSGVKCNDFILSSGVTVNDSTLVSRCFVGQGSILDKHYSALDSLFFSNCQGMHGEATAVFAGPYTVSHHKATLLIAGMFSFLNAGSGSNQSNHMYKLGPIHQGIACRGAKTTSDSYLLWPAKIGAFTLVMGRHTQHSDTSDLPFSYLIENGNQSYLVPAVNLRSVGTIRDAQKWPKRDNRKDTVLLDPINFNLLSPFTIQQMMNGIAVLENLLSTAPDEKGEYLYNNCKIRKSSAQKGIELYQLAICKFLGNSLIAHIKDKSIHSLAQLRELLATHSDKGLGHWVDMSGLIAPLTEVNRLMDEIEGDDMNLGSIQSYLNEMNAHFYDYQWQWVRPHLEKRWGKSIAEVGVEEVVTTIQQWKESVVKLDQLIYDDAKKEFDLDAKIGFGADGDEAAKQQDFENVRGSFEKNPFVLEVLQHIERKSALADKLIKQLKEVK